MLPPLHRAMRPLHQKCAPLPTPKTRKSEPDPLVGHRACSTTGSDRGCARSILLRWALRESEAKTFH